MGVANRVTATFGPILPAKLGDLTQPSLRNAFGRASAQAVTHLRREVADAALVDLLLALLAHPDPCAARLRELAVEEFLLVHTPNLAPLIDHYRRVVRPLSTQLGLDLPSWRCLAPAFTLFFQHCLPEALAAQGRLQPHWPTPSQRKTLDHVRLNQPSRPLLDQLLAEPSQTIVATQGAQIAHVQQTVVYGDLYTRSHPAPTDIAALFVRYRAFVIETFGTLDFRGIIQVQAAARIDLEQIYIPIQARIAADRRTPHGLSSAVPRLLHEYVCEQPFLVVLGDPGSGKSTLVRYLLTRLGRTSAHQPCAVGADWLPIFFPVAAFADARSRPGHADLAPLAYLRDYYAGLSQPDYGPLFLRALEHGQALLLLDGLDEVRTDRGGIVRTLEAFVREWDAQGNRFLATSRSVGYADAPLDPQLFTTVVIESLDEGQISDFIWRWSLAYEALAEAASPVGDDLYYELVRDAVAAELAVRVEQRTRSLRAVVLADTNVATLARNPLLLTILALIHNQGARLPDRRVDLYRLCVEALAETWNRTRSLSGRSVDLYLGDERLDERFVVNLLGPVALWIHREQPGGLVDQDDLEAHIAATLVQTDGLQRRRARRMAQDFVELMRRDTGLLQERGYRRFGFLHLTFEEYLAARGLLESVTVDDPDGLFQIYSREPRWREVLRLAIGSAPQREAQRLLLHLLATPPPRDHAVVLAGECLLDIGHNGASQRAWEQTIAELLALLADPATSLESRLAASRLLGQLGDPRRLDVASGDAVAGSYWCPISGGAFWLGDEGLQATTHRPRLHPAVLAHDLRIARLPVTNAEFAEFIAAGGYHERRWWSEAGWLWLAHGVRHPAYWEDANCHAPSQPVVGVAWYEAHAYCTWLTEVARRAGWLAAAERLRLPTSREWERAARDTDQRRYPWGDAPPTSSHAAYAGLGLHAPAAVGAFPAGAAACGALDLLGNCWEWTASLAEDSDSPLACEDVGRGETPLIRGGDLLLGAPDLRCGVSGWYQPGQRLPTLGFRMVRVGV